MKKLCFVEYFFNKNENKRIDDIKDDSDENDKSEEENTNNSNIIDDENKEKEFIFDKEYNDLKIKKN